MSVSGLYVGGKAIATHFFSDAAVSIDNGFSSRLCKRLKENYHLHIPETAEFLSGEFTNTMRDPLVIVSFKMDCLPNDEKMVSVAIADLLFENPKEYSFGKSASVPQFVQKYGTYTHQFTAKDNPFTTLYYCISSDGTAYFCFVGANPGSPIS